MADLQDWRRTAFQRGIHMAGPGEGLEFDLGQNEERNIGQDSDQFAPPMRTGGN